ncbi:G-box-binding factor 3 [Triticum urartu]|uniref:G-box-binding factor 3 n=1 Tax=Triticum urartu TaxID=4572 RepID=M8AV53_TRIUA|nr:G-box-binding factor 3 [Triticum urartu]
MAHDEAVAAQKTGKSGSPPKDQPAPSPYPDWSAMQAYYGSGVMPPAYFAPAIAAGHPPPPYMWGPQHMMPPPFGAPYAMYPHGGAYPHPLVPMMASPLSVEPAKSANSKDKSSNKKLKEIDGSAVSTGSGNSKKTSSSGDYSGEGSSDVNDLKCFPAPVIKPSVTNVANSRAIGTPVSPLPGVMGPIHTGISTELSSKDEREVKREKRKQSNRESARRSRLRKQAETEELATQVESLTAENTSLKSEIGKLTKSSEKLRIENSALVMKLKGTAAPTSAEMPLDKSAVAAPSSSPRVVENFLSMIDDTSKSGVKNHMEHSEPKLRQLLGSSATTDVVAAN